MPVALNKREGAFFEAMFVARAGACGCKALKNELSARILGNGKATVIKSDLDFRLIRRDGRVAYIDNKSFSGAFFTYSQINSSQLKRALAYESYNVPSGFVVWLKAISKVVFFKGTVIYAAGPKSRFCLSDGIILGDPFSFDVGRIFE